MTAQACRERLILGVLLVSVFAWRAQRSDQPILEGYVGRQVPTAMVARNLDRGSGFLSPQLDTGPFPNLFLVEPPIDAQIVAWLSRASGLAIDRTGRIVSAASIALACWGLHGLLRHREGGKAALIAVVALGVFPTTLKYGRAFQPDALALGLSVAGLRCWDVRGAVLWRWAGWTLCSLAFAQKVTWSFMLVPLCVAILRDGPTRRNWLAVSTIVPALAWYAFVAFQLAGNGGGTGPSRDNAANWLARVSPSSFLDLKRYSTVGLDLIVRSFTPLGPLMVVVGWQQWRSVDRLWRVWTIAASVALLALFGKLHHDYYGLMIAPLLAAWIGIAIGRMSRLSGLTMLAGLVILGFVQSRTAWRTPDAWRDAPALANAIGRTIPPDGRVIASEAILYLGDRRGCRLEENAGAVLRAANEWRPSPPFADVDPASLVQFYRDQAGARYFADLDSPSRRQLHDDVRRLPGAHVLEDVPGRYVIVGFDETTASKAPRP